jgi:tetratricopeptide (TPR) repeat protein
MQQHDISELERLLKLQEQTFGCDSTEVGETCYKVADLYFKDNSFELAESFYRRSLNTRLSQRDIHKTDVQKIETQLKLCHANMHPTAAPSAQPQDEPPSAESIGELDSHCVQSPQEKVSLPHNGTSQSSQRLNEAINDARVELELLKSFGGSESTAFADMSTKLAALYCRKQMYAEMEPLLLQSVLIWKSSYGANHPSVATGLKNLAQLYCHQEQFTQAEPLFKLALEIRTRAFGSDDPRVMEVQKNYAALLQKTCRQNEAVALEKQLQDAGNRRFKSVNAEF